MAQLTFHPEDIMDLYVVLYHHRHGVTPCVMYSKQHPTEEEMYAALKEMGEDTEDRREDEYVEAFTTTPKGPPELNKHRCDDGGCPGWLVTTDQGAIERCDTCKRFESDDHAVAHVLALEAIDTHYHFDAAAHRALVELREELSDLIESTQDYEATEQMTEVINRLETLLGRSFWLERHRWSEHGLQFARLLSELYSIGEESEDTETMKTPGYFSIKISDLCLSMDLEWDQILSLFERADMVFQSDKVPPEVKS